MSHFTAAPRLVAAEGGYQEFVLRGGEHAVLAFSALAALLAIAVGFHLMRGVLAADQGTPKMIEIAEAIQEGAAAYLRRQFRTIAVIMPNVDSILVAFADSLLGKCVPVFGLTLARNNAHFRARYVAYRELIRSWVYLSRTFGVFQFKEPVRDRTGDR